MGSVGMMEVGEWGWVGEWEVGNEEAGGWGGCLRSWLRGDIKPPLSDEAMFQ